MVNWFYYSFIIFLSVEQFWLGFVLRFRMDCVKNVGSHASKPSRSLFLSFSFALSLCFSLSLPLCWVNIRIDPKKWKIFHVRRSFRWYVFHSLTFHKLKQWNGSNQMRFWDSISSKISACCLFYDRWNMCTVCTWHKKKLDSFVNKSKATAIKK